MSDGFYNRLTLSDEDNRLLLHNGAESRSHRYGCQYSTPANAQEITGASSVQYRLDNRVDRTEINPHLKHRTQRRSTASQSANCRSRQRANDQHISFIQREKNLREYDIRSKGNYEIEERRTPVMSNVRDFDSGTILDRGRMPEIPRETPANNEQAVVVGTENSKSLPGRIKAYGSSDRNSANVDSSLVTYNRDIGSYVSYTQPSSQQAQLCPHVKGQKQDSLREDNNNISCVSYSGHDDKIYNKNSGKLHLFRSCNDRYTYRPGELDRQYRNDEPPSNYYYGIQTDNINMIRGKNSYREKIARPIPGAYAKNEKHSLSKSLPRNSRYTSACERNVNSSDSESGPSSSEREYWPNNYCYEKRKKRVRKKVNYRSKHYFGDSDPSEHSDPGRRRIEEYPGRICSSTDCDYEQHRSRSSIYGLNNKKNISRSLTSVSSLDDEVAGFRTGFTFNRISPRGKGKARISKVNIKSFSTVHLNPSPRATSSTGDIASQDSAHSHPYAVENNFIKTSGQASSKDKSPVVLTAELSDNSCTSPSLKKSPFNSHIRGRRSSVSGGETPCSTPVPRICSPEIVGNEFQAPASSSFKTIHAPSSEGSTIFFAGDSERNGAIDVDEGAKVLKNLIDNLEKDVEVGNPIETESPELFPLQAPQQSSPPDDVVSTEDLVISPTVSEDFFSPSNDGLCLTTGEKNKVSSFAFGKDVPYSIPKPFVTLVNIQEEDEPLHSDSSGSNARGGKESLTKIMISSEGQGDTNDTESNGVKSPLRRPSYVKAQISNQLSPKPEIDMNKVESIQTDLGIVETNGGNKCTNRDRDMRREGGNKDNNYKRSKKMERPRIPTILNLEQALDELFNDVKNQQAKGQYLCSLKIETIVYSHDNFFINFISQYAVFVC